MHCFTFDIETIPDVEFGRQMWNLEDLSDEEYYEKLSNDMSIGAIDFECLNMCKDSMTGMSISASRSFCINQCSMP